MVTGSEDREPKNYLEAVVNACCNFEEFIELYSPVATFTSIPSENTEREVSMVIH